MSIMLCHLNSRHPVSYNHTLAHTSTPMLFTHFSLTLNDKSSPETETTSCLTIIMSKKLSILYLSKRVFFPQGKPPVPPSRIQKERVNTL